jgi:hypothetical protein
MQIPQRDGTHLPELRANIRLRQHAAVSEPVRGIFFSFFSFFFELQNNVIRSHLFTLCVSFRTSSTDATPRFLSVSSTACRIFYNLVCYSSALHAVILLLPPQTHGCVGRFCLVRFALFLVGLLCLCWVRSVFVLFALLLLGSLYFCLLLFGSYAARASVQTHGSSSKQSTSQRPLFFGSSVWMIRIKLLV